MLDYDIPLPSVHHFHSNCSHVALQKIPVFERTAQNECDEDRIFISVVTVAELRHGIEHMSSGVRRERIDKWLTEELLLRFEGRLLGVDIHVANVWGIFMTRLKTSGHSIGPMDACIAAIAEHHGLSLVTRNVADFKAFKIKVINPWTGS